MSRLSPLAIEVPTIEKWICSIVSFQMSAPQVAVEAIYRDPSKPAVRGHRNDVMNSGTDGAIALTIKSSFDFIVLVFP